MEPIHFPFNSVVFLLLLFVALSLFLENFASAVSQCLQADSSALLRLKRGFTSDKLNTWLSETDCCIWEGVTCDEFGRVAGLDLSNRSIIGTLNPSLFNLTSLHTLNFSNNNFYGTSIPDSGWDRLANLSRLDLSAGFGGKVPTGISRLSKLTSLHLSNYGLYLPNNPTFFKNMSTLRELHLNGVNLSIYQNDWCGALVNSTPVLEVLSMEGCSLTSAGCSSLLRLPHLSVVNLGYNNLDSSIFDSFVNLTSLSQLQVQGNGIKGYFPKQIFQLRSLMDLDISDNVMLSGSLPDFLDGSSLEMLILSETNLSGNLPYTIGNLKFLKKLDLSRCQFSGRIPPTIGNLTKLEELDLSYNKNLYGEIPRSVFQISGLQWLSLASNNFSGDLKLEFVKNLKNLFQLDLSNNRFSLDLSDAYDESSSSFFPNMFILHLANCNLTKIPSFIKYQRKLTDLDLSRNLIHGEIPSYLLSIESLNLSCNFFTYIPEPPLNLSFPDGRYIFDLHSNLLEGAISHLLSSDIVYLDFSNNQFTNFIPSNLSSSLKSTQHFSLANNNLIGEIPSSICNLTYLFILDLSNNKLNGVIPPCLLEDGSFLEILNLAGNQLHGVIPHGINQHCDLQCINFSNNQLEGVLPRSLTNCQLLQILDLGNNKLNDTFPYWLGNMSWLMVLILRSNKFHGLVEHLDGNHKTIYTFSMLHVFDISSNNFSGKLFENYFSIFKSMMINREDTTTNFIDNLMGYYDFYVLSIMNKGQLMLFPKIWKMVKSIDFSNNHFEGEIPISIGQLVFLEVLNMSQNYLTGRIPWQLVNLSQLESLDFSMNSLSGNIPQELVSLYFLSHLNLSYNKLAGKIPMGGQFSTFPKTSFEGNKGLYYDFPYNRSVPKVNHTITPSSSLDGNAQTNTSYMIVLGILFGVGFGVCMATVVVLDVMCFDKIWKRRSQTPLHG